MITLKDAIASELSELRNMVLGAQILLGFQYEALFMPRFHATAAVHPSLFVCGFLALVSALVVLVAPTSHHRLAEHGQATRAQSRFATFGLSLGALLFALALGCDVGFALGQMKAAWWAFAFTSLAALTAWLFVEMIMRPNHAASEPEPAVLSLKETLSELMSESRIVLPGVQALLGFQLAAYLSDGFAKLSPAAQNAHHGGLVLLLASMILLMAPAPFHRIAEHGRPTRRAEAVGVWLVMSGLAFLALALSADCYVALSAVTRDANLAALGAGATAFVSILIWFVYPFAKRMFGHGARPHETAAQS